MFKKIYIAIAIVIVLIALIASKLLFSHESLPRQQQVAQEIIAYQAEIDSLQKVIESHKQEIERLKTDSLYKEQILRTKYGMTRKDEKVFQMVK